MTTDENGSMASGEPTAHLETFSLNTKPRHPHHRWDNPTPNPTNILMKTTHILVALGLFLTVSHAPAAGDSTDLIFNFSEMDSEQGWRVNILNEHPNGGKGSVSFEPFEDPDGGRVVRLTSESAGHFHLVSPDITLPPKADLVGFQIKYRMGADSEPLFLVVVTEGNHYYVAPLPPTDGAWETQIVTKFQAAGASGTTPPLDFQKLKRIYIRGGGKADANADISLSSISLVFGEQP